MLIKIKRSSFLAEYPAFPQSGYDPVKDEEVFVYPQVFAGYTLTLQSKSSKGHGKLLGVELAKLAREAGIDSLIFLGDNDTSWLYQDSDYKPVMEAIHSWLTARSVKGSMVHYR